MRPLPVRVIPGRLLIVSDLHLEPERPAVTERFLRFLAEEAMGAEALYVLGDLFEVWLGDDAAPPLAEEVAAALRRLARRGTAVHLMHGNRDFLLGEAFAARAGARLLAEPARVRLPSGEEALLLHGDSLCIDDVDYQRFRAQVRDPARVRAFLALPPEERARLARGFRDASRALTRAKPQAIMDAHPGEVRRVLAEAGLRCLIHGHTHRPGVHRLPGGGRRIVLGDWDEDRASWLLCGPGGERLVQEGPAPC